MPDIDEGQFVQEMTALEQNGTPVQLCFSPTEAWVVMSLLQLSLRHPGIVGPTRVVAEAAARQIIQSLVDKGMSPGLLSLAEQGFDERYDIGGVTA